MQAAGGARGGPERRTEPRYHIARELEAVVSLGVAPAAVGAPEPPGETATGRLIDFSRYGLRFRSRAGHSPGRRLACRLALLTVDEPAVRFEAEVRWCVRLDPDDYETGARIPDSASDERLAVFERFLRYVKDIPARGG